MREVLTLYCRLSLPHGDLFCSDEQDLEEEEGEVKGEELQKEEEKEGELESLEAEEEGAEQGLAASEEDESPQS